MDKRGKVVDNPVYYSKDRRRVTKGGEWIVPKELQVKSVERYQRGGELLMLVDVPSHTVLPGKIETSVKAAEIKQDVFKIAKPKAESGVTK